MFFLKHTALFALQSIQTCSHLPRVIGADSAVFSCSLPVRTVVHRLDFMQRTYE